MSSDPALAAEEEERQRGLRACLTAGLAAVALAWLLSWVPGSVSTPLRALCLIVGLLAGGEAVSRGYQSWRVLAWSALIAFVARMALDSDWDSLRLALGVLVLVALLGAALAALPQQRRWTVLSCLVVLHFSAILTAVLATPNPPWLAEQFRIRLYQPYLEFMNLTDTYKYFAPEPGPEPLLWFRLEYADGSARWVEVREPEDYATNLEWLRWGLLAAAAHQMRPTGDVPEDLIKRREKAGEELGIPGPEGDLKAEFQVPTPHAMLMISSYARYVARNYPSLTDPDQPVTKMKVYGAVRQALSPEQFVEEGSDPRDPTQLSVYYLGEFDAEGKLTRAGLDDPFLYWLIPIERDENGQIIDYVRTHAGDPPSEEEP